MLKFEVDSMVAHLRQILYLLVALAILHFIASSKSTRADVDVKNLNVEFSNLEKLFVESTAGWIDVAIDSAATSVSKGRGNLASQPFPQNDPIYFESPEGLVIVDSSLKGLLDLGGGIFQLNRPREQIRFTELLADFSPKLLSSSRGFRPNTQRSDLPKVTRSRSVLFDSMSLSEAREIWNRLASIKEIIVTTQVLAVGYLDAKNSIASPNTFIANILSSNPTVTLEEGGVRRIVWRYGLVALEANEYLADKVQVIGSSDISPIGTRLHLIPLFTDRDAFRRLHGKAAHIFAIPQRDTEGDTARELRSRPLPYVVVSSVGTKIDLLTAWLKSAGLEGDVRDFDKRFSQLDKNYGERTNDLKGIRESIGNRKNDNLAVNAIGIELTGPDVIWWLAFFLLACHLYFGIHLFELNRTLRTEKPRQVIPWLLFYPGWISTALSYFVGGLLPLISISSRLYREYDATEPIRMVSGINFVCALGIVICGWVLLEIRQLRLIANEVPLALGNDPGRRKRK